MAYIDKKFNKPHNKSAFPHVNGDKNAFGLSKKEHFTLEILKSLLQNPMVFNTDELSDDDMLDPKIYILAMKMAKMQLKVLHEDTKSERATNREN